MTHPIIEAVRSMAEMLVGREGVADVRGVAGSQHLTIEVHPATDAAAGKLIGRDGQTVEAMRHLVERGGRALQPQIQVFIAVLSPGRA